MRFLCIVLTATIFLGCSQEGAHVETTKPTLDSAQLSYEQRQGKRLYEKYCAVCHGDQGKGDGFNAFNLDPKPRDLTDLQYMEILTDARLNETIAGGGRRVNKSLLMPSWGGRLTNEEIVYVVDYVRYLGTRR